MTARPGRRSLPAAAAAATALLLSACQSEPMGGPLVLEEGASAPVAALQQINEAGARCWMRSGDRAFADYRLVPELDTRVGTPRLLIVERARSEGLPQLVIEAAGDPVRIVTYGPLTAQRLGGRINGDIMRWSAGSRACRG